MTACTNAYDLSDLKLAPEVAEVEPGTEVDFWANASVYEDGTHYPTSRHLVGTVREVRGTYYVLEDGLMVMPSPGGTT